MILLPFLPTRDNFQLGYRGPDKSKGKNKEIYTPPPVNLSHVAGIQDPGVKGPYPTAFDLRAENKLPPVNDQGDRNDCWIYATFGALESYLMPRVDNHYSPMYMSSYTGFDPPPGMGGNFYMATAILARWDGPVRVMDYLEAAFDPLHTPIRVRRYVDQVVFLPHRTGPLDNETIKHFVSNYGAVYADVNKEENFYSDDHLSFYCPKPKASTHAICIVGWDDDFCASRFKKRPPGNGAFIIRNSYGKKFGDGGYFYVSYYDRTLQVGASFNHVSDASEYGRNYQYDLLGNTGNTGFMDTEAWGANVFTAQDSNPIKAVSFYTNDAHVKYRIEVYTGVADGNPTNGKRVVSQEGEEVYPGYYSKKLENLVPVKKGEQFSVVIKFQNTVYEKPIPIEEPIANHSSRASAQPGESYVSPDGTDWYDLARIKPNTNVCIKAFSAPSL